VITAEKFSSMPPKVRGFAVYMFGERDDEPHVPNESNPYPPGSDDAAEWDEGQRLAVLEAQDSEE
jgi:hypothetical protein